MLLLALILYLRFDLKELKRLKKQQEQEQTK